MIAQLCDALFIALMILNLLMLGSNRILRQIHFLRLQGLALALLCLLWPQETSMYGVLLSLLVIGLKVGLQPGLLKRAFRIMKAKYETQPYLGIGSTMLLGAVGTTAAFLLCDTLPLHQDLHQSLLLPASFASLWTGFLLLTTRLKAVSQLIGYFVFDNGLFLWAVLLFQPMPHLVGLCLLPNVFLTLLAVGIAHQRTQSAFALIEQRDCTQLKEE